MLSVHAVIIRYCARFLAESPSLTPTAKWRTRFILLDLLYGLCWTTILIYPAGLDIAANTMMMFLMLLVIAVSSMVAANLPNASLAATAPVTIAIALNLVLSGTFDGRSLQLPMAGLTVAKPMGPLKSAPPTGPIACATW